MLANNAKPHNIELTVTMQQKSTIVSSFIIFSPTNCGGLHGKNPIFLVYSSTTRSY